MLSTADTAQGEHARTGPIARPPTRRARQRPQPLTERECRTALADAGLVDVEIRPTHRVHEHAGSAIIRAGKP